mmetsp:Transcript_9945/g.40266  ORF Transcript_9945/g.40266 Transcript_9945/m.40266 type:complete len:216 (-) Transcript_9945:682-1329(-)
MARRIPVLLVVPCQVMNVAMPAVVRVSLLVRVEHEYALHGAVHVVDGLEGSLVVHGLDRNVGATVKAVGRGVGAGCLWGKGGEVAGVVEATAAAFREDDRLLCKADVVEMRHKLAKHARQLVGHLSYSVRAWLVHVTDRQILVQANPIELVPESDEHRLRDKRAVCQSSVGRQTSPHVGDQLIPVRSECFVSCQQLQLCTDAESTAWRKASTVAA